MPINPLLREDRGQDLIEYTLLLAFLVISAAALFLSTGRDIGVVWSSGDQVLSNARTVASGNPGGGSGGGSPGGGNPGGGNPGGGNPGGGSGGGNPGGGNPGFGSGGNPGSPGNPGNNPNPGRGR